MVRPPARALLASLTVSAVIACATARPEPPPGGAVTETSGSESLAGWPDSWGTDFGLRCAAAGEDVRFCACVAKEIQKRWTPEQFRSVGPEGLQDEVRACRERIRGAGAE
jgi:hypothetical protein